MKKLVFLTVLLLSCITSFAANPIKNPFAKFMGSANYIKWAPVEVEAFRSFIYDCRLKDYDAKDIAKMQKKYEKLIQKYPDKKYHTMCLMGMYYLRTDGKIVSYKDGFDLFKEGYDRLSESEENISFVNIMNPVLAWAYLTGRGPNQDFQKAFELYNVVTVFQESLYNRLKNLKETDEEYPKLYYLLSNLAENEFAELYLPLFYSLILGIGTQVDESLALNWYKVIKSMDKVDYPILKFDQIKAEMENLIYERKWSKENNIANSAREAFREGILKWYADNDFEGAKAQFEKAISQGHLPSLCELAMMYVDDNWGMKDGKEQFNSLTSLAISNGYIPALHILGLYKIDHWGKKGAFTSSGEGEAYPLFEEAANKGFTPSKEILALYDSGVYGRKTGLAAALSDLNEGFNDGRTEKKSLGENLKEVGAGYAALGQALSSGGSSNSSGSSSSSVSRRSAGRSTSSGGSSSSAGTSSSDKQYNEALQQYQKWEDKAQYWIDSFMDERAWLTHFNPQSDSQSDLSNHQSHYDSAIKELKAILTSFKQCRQKSDNQIAKGEIEEKVEWCLSQGYPK